MNTRYSCPGCRQQRTFAAVDGGRMFRCDGCGWLARLVGDQMQTAMPAALRARPAKAKRVRFEQTDLTRLDALLAGGHPPHPLTGPLSGGG